MGMGFVFRNDIYESAEVTPFDGDSVPTDEEGSVPVTTTTTRPN